MGAVEEEDGLGKEDKHIEEADEVTDGVFHRVIPKGVDDAPGDDIAVIVAKDLKETFVKFDFFAENETAARGF